MEAFPKVTVVVPIRNEEIYISETIGYLLGQDYPHEKLEILVVVGDSVDRTVDIVKEIESRESRVKYIYNPKGYSSSARNIGAKNASGEIIVYIDGHTYIDNDQVLKNTARLMNEKEISVLSRPQFLDTPENKYFQQAVSLARKSIIGHGLDSTIYTQKEIFVDPSSSGAAYKKEVFEKVGYFDENFDACEDFDFNFRVSQAGYKSFTSMKLAVFYYPRTSIKALFYQMKRYGIGRFRLAIKHPKTMSLGTLIPPLFTAGMLLLALLSFFSDVILFGFAMAFGLYFSVITGWSVIISLKKGLKFLIILPFIYVVIHIGLGWGFLIGFLKIGIRRLTD